MLTPAQAKGVITKWIDAANKKDVEAVLALYAADPEVVSPAVIEIMGDASGAVRGSSNVRAYLTKAFALPYVHWHFVDVAYGVSSLCARYINHKGTRSFTYMELNAAGKIRRHVNHFME